jgi:hypothetical protein
MIVDRKIRLNIENPQFQNILNKLNEKIGIEELWVLIDPSLENFEKIKKLKFNYKNFEEYGTNDLIKILENEKPDLILIGNDYDFFIRSFIVAAKFKKIPIVLLLSVPTSRDYLDKMDFSMIKGKIKTHSNRIDNIIKKIIFMLSTYKKTGKNIFSLIKIFVNEINTIFSHYQPWGEYDCDLVLVTSTQWKEHLTKKKVSSKIVVVGYPTMDDVFLKISEIKRNNKKNKSEMEFLLLTTPMVEHGLWTEKEWKQTIEKTILEINDKFPSSKITVKIHPISESLEKYSELLKKFGSKIKIFQREDLIEIISNSDVVITYGQSSSILQASLLEKPIIVINLFNYPLEKMPFLKEKIGIELKNIDELKEIISNIDKKHIQNNVKNYISKHLYKFDGNVSERASNAIIEIIKK